MRKGQRAAVRLEKEMVQARCKEYLAVVQELLDAKGYLGPLLNTYELNALQILLYCFLCNNSAKLKKLGLPEVKSYYSFEECYQAGKHLRDQD